MGSERRPDRVGAVFGALLVVALTAVVIGVAVLEPGGRSGGGRTRLIPGGRDDAAALTVEHDEPRGGGLARPGALPPLYTEGPRELVPPAPHEPDVLQIPRLAISTRLLRLDKRGDGAMEVPGDFSLAGWYVRAPRPGEIGPAVIAGHLDSRRGPAVFARLGELEPGDELLVRRGDGHVVRFVVRAVERYAKAAFPTQKVYGNTAGAELRLITCDGEFDRTRRSYDQNLVVYAAADPATLPPPSAPSASPEPSAFPDPSSSPDPSASPEPAASSEPSTEPSATPTDSPGSAPPSDAEPTPEPATTPSAEPSPSPSPTRRLLP